VHPPTLEIICFNGMAVAPNPLFGAKAKYLKSLEKSGNTC
jgi:hypothetical protein